MKAPDNTDSPSDHANTEPFRDPTKVRKLANKEGGVKANEHEAYELARWLVEYEFTSPNARYKSHIELAEFYASKLETLIATRTVEAIDLLYWKYKEMNDQSVDMKFAEAYGIVREELTASLEKKTDGGNDE